MPETNTADMQRQLTTMELRWQNFWTYRHDWSLLIRRQKDVKLDSRLDQYAQGVNIKSPILEEDRGTHMRVLNSNPTKIDAASMVATKDARKDVDDARIWLASQWNRVNDGGWLDASWAQGITDYGLWACRLMHHEMREPEDDIYDGIEDAAEKLKARKQYFADQDDSCFDIVDVSPLEICFWPLDNPTLVFQKSEIPYIDADIERAVDLGGGKLTVDDVGKIAWLGDPEVPADRGVGIANQHNEKKLTYIVRDAQDPKTKQWKTTEYVCVGGDYANAEMVRESVNPLNRSCYFFAASGDEVPLETDPHLRFRPKLYTEMVLVGQKNYLMTMIAALANREVSEDVAIDASKLTNENINLFLDMGATEEVQAGRRRLVFRKPEPSSDEVSVLPGAVIPWPHKVSDHMMLMLEMTERELAECRPNRWMAGNAFDEAKEGTYRANLDQHQAAAAPYGADLKKHDRMIKQILEAMLAFVVSSNQGLDEDTAKEYPAVTTGDEMIMRGSVDPGVTTVMTPDKAKRRMTITVLTKNETQSEKATNDQQARAAYHEFHEDTELDYYRRLGYDDPEQHAEDLEKERIKRLRQPRSDQVLVAACDQYLSARTGLNLTMMQGGPYMPPQDQYQKPQVQQQGDPMRPAPIEFGGGSSQMAGVGM